MSDMGQSNFTFRGDHLQALRDFTATRPGTTMTDNARAALDLFIAVQTIDPAAAIGAATDAEYPLAISGEIDPAWRERLADPSFHGFIMDESSIDELKYNPNARYILFQAIRSFKSPVRIATSGPKMIADLGMTKAQAVITLARHSFRRISLAAIDTDALAAIMELSTKDPMLLFSCAHAAVEARRQDGWTVLTTAVYLDTYTQLGVRAIAVPHA